MDILDTNTEPGVDLKGIPLVVGINLLNPYANIEIGYLALYNISGSFADPTYDNIETDFQLIYLSRDEI